MPDELPPELHDNAEPEMDAPPFPIVAIGASAGGIDALKRMFPYISADSGAAFVVVLHLDPDRPSALTDIIARCTNLPVTTAEDGEVIEPNHVYVAAPNSVVTINRNQLAVDQPRRQRNVVDELLLSLAETYAERIACVILSGTGSDGTVGLRAIKESGGLALAQDDAEYDGMMRSAVATGLVDFTLPAEEIAGKLADYLARTNDGQQLWRHDPMPAQASAHFKRIAEVLRIETGHDFSNYKDRTILRRIQRRMNALQVSDIADFAELLQREPREVTILFRNLLIGVTNFFRDPEAFAALESETVPSLFAGKGPNDTVRVWVPGCSTGEEVYSLAILLREFAADPRRAPTLQIFGSDIDDQALAVARTGRYPATIAKDVSERRLAEFFVKEEGTYTVNRELREMCLFSAHNLLRDAPFSRLGLISCRNLLIYFSSPLQDRLIPLFHYALAPNGSLFLGSSENVSRHTRLFATVDKVHRIFRRKDALERIVPEFPLTHPDQTRRTAANPARLVSAQRSDLKGIAERHVLDRFSPAFVVVNADGDVLHSSGQTGEYLELPAGAPDTNLFNLARLGLRLDLRAAFHRATATRQAAVRRDITLGTKGGQIKVDLHVQPLRLRTEGEATYIVVFQVAGEITRTSDIVSDAEGADAGETSVLHLETELRLTRERLQSTTEELESANEELKSSNEELQSINEEMQSTNEELETSKEELQSINEELQTVNAELSARVEDLSRSNNDLTNLLESTQIATVFLDRALAVKGFTPAAKDVFRLVESDVGRPILHVRSRHDGDTLQEDAERVLRTLTTIERQVQTVDTNARYIMRLLPYRTAENVISGVVLTFTDITRITIAEARIEALTRDLHARIAELETILDLAPVGVLIMEDLTSREFSTNAYGSRLSGHSEPHKGLRKTGLRDRLVDETQRELSPDEHPIIVASQSGQTISGWQGRLRSASGLEVPVMISASPLLSEAGTVRGAVAAIVDISQHKTAQAQQQFLLSELQHRVKNILATVSSLANRMARSQGSADAFKAAFISRLDGMARTHDLLSGGAWSGANLKALILASLEPHLVGGENNLRMDGPDISLLPGASSTIGMIFHELATNAVKYGALSKVGGHIEISWHLLPGDAAELTVTWAEFNGPPVDASAARGFGTSFVTRSVGYELSGRADIELAPEGVRFQMWIPVATNVEPSQEGPQGNVGNRP